MPLGEVSRESGWVSSLMSCTFLPKAPKPAWTNQLTRLPCPVIYVKFQFMYATTSKIGSLLSLAFTSSNVFPGRGSEKACNECLWGKQCLPLCRPSPTFGYLLIVFHFKAGFPEWFTSACAFLRRKCCHPNGANFHLTELHSLILIKIRL